MTLSNSMAWEKVSTIVTIASSWVTVLAEQWNTDDGRLLEYWRVERPDSVIVIPIYRGTFLLSPPVFRPGVGRETLDFPGGRVPAKASAAETVAPVLKRELGICPDQVAEIRPINPSGWPVDSSFSSQELWGFVAHLDDTCDVDKAQLGDTYPATAEGVEDLLGRLDCLQCRAVLLQWLLRSKFNDA